MHPVATRQRSRRAARPGRSHKSPSGFSQVLRWWPLLLALVATPFAVRAASVLVLSGPGALRLLYPFVALMQTHATSTLMGTLTLEQRDMFAEWTIWAQFPIYGLVASFIGLRHSVTTGLVTVLLLHVLAVVAVILFAPTS